MAKAVKNKAVNSEAVKSKTENKVIKSKTENKIENKVEKKIDNKVESRVMALAEPLCAEQGAELVAVEWQKAGRDWILRLYIDCEGSVGHELCAKVSQAVGDALDAEDFIDISYNLEVSSPGLERPLLKPADFQRFAGEPVSIKLFAAKNGQKQFYGELAGYNETEGVALIEENSGQRMVFALAEIAKAHLVFKF